MSTVSPPGKNKGLREAMGAALLIWHEMISIPCVKFARAKRTPLQQMSQLGRIRYHHLKRKSPVVSFMETFT